MEQIIKDLKLVRNYFGEHDKTTFEHFAYAVIDSQIKELQNNSDRAIVMQGERPNITDYFDSKVIVKDVQKEYLKCLAMFKYMSALDRYIDELEDNASADVLLAEQIEECAKFIENDIATIQTFKKGTATHLAHKLANRIRFLVKNIVASETA